MSKPLHPYEYTMTTGDTPSGAGWEVSEKIGRFTFWRRLRTQ